MKILGREKGKKTSSSKKGSKKSLPPFLLLLLFMTANVYIFDESRPIMTIPRANIAIATDERDEGKKNVAS